MNLPQVVSATEWQSAHETLLAEANIPDARASERTFEAFEHLGAVQRGLRLATGRMREHQVPILLVPGALPIELELDSQTVSQRHASA